MQSWYSKIGFKSDLYKSECTFLSTFTRGGLRLLSKRINIYVYNQYSVFKFPQGWLEGDVPEQEERAALLLPPVVCLHIHHHCTLKLSRQNIQNIAKGKTDIRALVKLTAKTNKEQTNSWFTNYIWVCFCRTGKRFLSKKNFILHFYQTV